MGLFSRNERRAFGPTNDFWYSPVSGESQSGVDVTADSALGLSAVWAAVNAISSTIATLPTKLLRTDGTIKTLVRDHPAARRFRVAPNSWQTPSEFKEMLQGHVLLRGNAYVQVVRNRLGQPEALIPLNPDRVKVYVGNDGVVRYALTRADSSERIFRQDEIWHLRNFTTNGLVGIAPLTHHRDVFGLAIATERYGARFFAKDARPGGVLKTPGKLTERGRANLKESWRAVHEGVSRAHAVAILEEGLEWQTIGVSAEDAQFLQTRGFQIAEVARIFNVPPHILKDLTRATFSNIEQQALELVQHTIRPWLVKWEESMNRALLAESEQDTLFFKFELNGLLRGDSTSRGDYYSKMFNLGAFSVNDILELEDRNPVKGGDQRFVPLNMVPLESASDVALAATTPQNDAPAEDDDDDEDEDDALRALVTTTPETAVVDQAQARRTAQSLDLRYRAQQSYQTIVEDLAARVVARETKDVGRIIRQEIGKRGLVGLNERLTAFYAEFGATVSQLLGPALRAYADLIYGLAADEVGFNPTPTPEFRRFVEDYIENAGSIYATKSARQLAAIVAESADQPETIEPKLEERLDEWKDRRAKKVALRETVQGGGAFAKGAYLAAGVSRLVWRTRGEETCPFCSRLNGRVVGISQNFVEAGGLLSGGDGVEPLRRRSSMGHPQAHGGCDCMIAAVI